jgi:CBS domain-containing protein
MSATVDSIESADSISYAAQRMAEDDMGALLVLSEGRLAGIVTDRDIAVRGIATGIPAHAPVRRIMTEDVATCSPDDDIETVLALMAREQIRRMPVCNGEDVVGIVTLADLAKLDPDKKEVTETLADICEPSGLHSQPPVFA